MKLSEIIQTELETYRKMPGFVDAVVHISSEFETRMINEGFQYEPDVSFGPGELPAKRINGFLVSVGRSTIQCPLEIRAACLEGEDREIVGYRTTYDYGYLTGYRNGEITFMEPVRS